MKWRHHDDITYAAQRINAVLPDALVLCLGSDYHDFSC